MHRKINILLVSIKAFFYCEYSLCDFYYTGIYFKDILETFVNIYFIVAKACNCNHAIHLLQLDLRRVLEKLCYMRLWSKFIVTQKIYT